MDPNHSNRTITFLFTDIEGSTGLLHKLGEGYQKILTDHHTILKDAIKKFNGREIDNAGDGFFIIFDNAKNAVAAAREVQIKLAGHNWTDTADIKVRMGIHTGEALKNETGYVGIDIHKAARIGASGHGGQVLISESTKALVCNDLAEGLSIKELGEFNLKDFEKPERIFQLLIPGLQTDFPSLKSASNKKNNLPSQLTKLIGRETELEKLEELIKRSETRLVTLTGPGGTGKTSLAYKASENLIENFKDGVYAVLLSSVSEPSIVAGVIANTLGITESPSKPIVESLKSFLQEKEILLFLDNYEQIVSSADLLEELLNSSPGLKILVTSRIILHLKSEIEYFVPPLSLPELKENRSTESLSQYSAVKLFIERARSVNPDFKVTNENAPAIAEICVQLDGLPLAIELASARIKLFTPGMILSRLSSKLDILKSSSRSLPERHQTLRQAILWSYELLSEDEKKIFRWMSVFTGGCTLEAIENIFFIMDPEIGILDGVEALLDKSLLRRTSDNREEPRFFMLETIREFSTEYLIGEEQKQIRKAYVDYYLDLAETAEPFLVTGEMEIWLNRLDAEKYNFRTVLNWAIENDDSGIALRLGGALLRFWIIRGSLIEGSKEMNRILSIPSAKKNSAERAKVLNASGTLIHEISHYKDSVPYIEESLAIYRKLNDEDGIANALNNISWVNVHLGNLDNAKKLCDESLIINKKLNNKRGIAVVMNNLSWLSLQHGEFEKSRSLSLEGMNIRKELGDKRGVAFSKINFSWAEIMLGNYDNAEKLLLEGIETVTELKDRQLIAWASCIKSMLHYARGEYEASESCNNESIRIMRDIGNQWGVAFEITNLGHLKHLVGDLKTGKELLEKAVELFSETGSRWGMSRSRLYLGYIFLDEGNFERAGELFKESLALNIELRNKYGIAQCFSALAGFAISKKDFRRAAKLFSCAEQLDKTINYIHSKSEKERLEKNIKILKENFEENTARDEKKFSGEDCIKTALE